VLKGRELLAGMVVGRGVTRRIKGADLFRQNKYHKTLNLPRHHEHITHPVPTRA
jgi:hypothetical protein